MSKLAVGYVMLRPRKASTAAIIVCISNN